MHNSEQQKTVSIKELIAPARGAMIVAGSIACLAGLLSVFPYISLTHIAGALLNGAPPSSLWTWIGIAVGSLVISQLLYSYSLTLTHIAEAKLRYRLRRGLVDTLGKISLGSVETTSSGKIRKMVCDDTESIHVLVAHIAGDVTFAIVSLLAGLSYLFWTNWLLTLILLGLWLISIGCVYAIMFHGYQELTEKYMRVQTELAGATVEMVEGIKEIKNFQASDTTQTRFDNARRIFTSMSFEWTKKGGRLYAIAGAFLSPGVVFATVVPLVLWFISSGWMAPSSALPFLILAPGIPMGLRTAIGLMQHTYTATQAAEDTAALMSLPHLPISDAQESNGDEEGTVRLDRVSFAYEDNKDVLRDVSFVARPGTVTALVGPSGGGKTTVARLIARFYDTTAGSVYVNGYDVRTLSQSELLTSIAIVFQDVALAHDTVAHNIALGDDSPSQKRIEEAARAAHIHDRVMRLPHGYDTVIGDAGGFLSGGERQRLTIARAFYHDAPIVILDEATAQSDPHSEHHIHEALSTLTQNRTVIVIAHRLSTIASADHIVVVDHGCIVESGTHSELIAQQG
ncbi:MAG: ABC transporter ATP-binding protein, partial [Actinobacteria bacterium]